jgi:ABC-type glycerol-3-phosphate transport system substrate-binding protein
MIRTMLAAASLSLVMSVSAHAACAFQNTVPLRTLSAGFDAWKAVTGAMAECGNVQSELDQDFAKKHVAAFAANPALYHVGGVATETFVPLLNAGTIRPLDDLVAKYGQKLTPNQLIRVDGKIMAIAMMVNAQHLMYREDIFAQHGIAAPKSYDDVLAAARKLREVNAVPFPIGATMRTGWNLAQDFVNMYMGHGQPFFGADNRPAISGPAGVKALETMKALTAFMDPEYLTADSTFVQRQFQQGRIAMANLWASRAGALDDPKESTVVGKVKMVAAPTAVPGGKPATTVWWDGAVIAKNITDAEADAAFRVLMEGMDRQMVEANNNAAVWLIEGFKPGRTAEGAIATINAGTPAYPASTRMGLLHTALGSTLGDFFTGKTSAEATLKAVEDKYLVAAREAGLVR